MLLTPRQPWPRHVPVTQVRPPALNGANPAVLTFIGHATFLIQTGAGNLLTDPMFSTYASPIPFLGPRRVRAPGIAIADLPEIAVILLSHNHYDHCDVPSLRAIGRRFDPLVVTPMGNGRLARGAGLRRVEELEWWATSSTAPVPVTLTPAQHFSARHPYDRNRALWAGFHFSVSGRRVYFTGDSGYGPHFREIGERLGAPDLALLPIGAYEPRWFMRDIHMNPAEAVQAHVDLGSRQSVAMHWGTFQLTPEAIDAPVRALGDELRTRGVPDAAFRVLESGESLAVQ